MCGSSDGTMYASTPFSFMIFRKAASVAAGSAGFSLCIVSSSVLSGSVARAAGGAPTESRYTTTEFVQLLDVRRRLTCGIYWHSYAAPDGDEIDFDKDGPIGHTDSIT